VVDSQLSGGDWGLRLQQSNDNALVRNTTNSSYESIQLLGSNGNRVADSVIDGDGIVVRGSGNAIVGATIPGGGSLARPVLIEGDANVLRDSSIGAPFAGQPWAAVTVAGGAGNVVRDNDVVDVDLLAPFPQDGIFVASVATGTRLVGNFVSTFSDDGIDVESPGSVLRFNTANDNGDLGIEAVGGVVGVGNSASGNGNPSQCVGVTC